MIKIETDGFEFSFEDAIEAFVFDETDKLKATYHGAPMKGVDVVAEFSDAYVYVELKDYDDSTEYNVLLPGTEEERAARKAHLKWLKNYLKYKFRDSYLYRHAEHKVDKPIHYICLVTFDNALNTHLAKQLRQELPVGMSSRRWNQSLATSCQVVNLDKWNTNFPKWSVTRMADAAGV